MTKIAPPARRKPPLTPPAAAKQERRPKAPLVGNPIPPGVPPACIALDAASIPTENALEESKTRLQEILSQRKIGKSLVLPALECLETCSALQKDRNLRVAFKLAQWEASESTIAAALLMDCPSSTPCEETAPLLKNRNDLKNYACNYSKPDAIDNLRGLLFARAANHEILLLLAAEDLVDLERYANQQIELAHAQKSFHVTAWILRYLNFEEEANKLEDLAYLQIDPVRYKEIEQMIGTDRSKALENLRNDAEELAIIIPQECVCQIKYRLKRVASAAKKMAEGRSIYDKKGFRVIANSLEDCYEIADKITQHFSPEWTVLEREDRIAKPKQNGYQAIHIIFENAQSQEKIEIQILSKEMDRKAAIGSAARISYKLNEPVPPSMSDLDPETDRKTIAANNFQAKQAALKQNGVFFVYYKDNLIKLVTESAAAPTVLDAACAVNPAHIFSAASATVNRQHAALAQGLASGDIITEFQTGTQAQTGRRIELAKTTFAQAIICAADKGLLELSQLSEPALIIKRGKAFFDGCWNRIMADQLRIYRPLFSKKGLLRNDGKILVKAPALNPTLKTH